jgi:hypothetical protein
MTYFLALSGESDLDDTLNALLGGSFAARCFMQLHIHLALYVYIFKINVGTVTLAMISRKLWMFVKK